MIALGLALVAGYPRLASLVLAQLLAGRLALSGALLFPLAFFLGMPFPLGILAVRHQPRGAVAWAWGMNGTFTAVGGLLAALLSLWEGFDFATPVALACYAGALAVFDARQPRSRVRRWPGSAIGIRSNRRRGQHSGDDRAVSRSAGHAR